MDRVERILLELLEIDTRSGQPDGNREALQKLGTNLSASGVQDISIEGEEHAKYLFAMIPGVSANEGLLLFSHADTADWNEADWLRPPLGEVSENGLIYGRGALDCKSLAAIHANVFMTMAERRHRLYRPLGLIVTTDEESGGQNGMGAFCKDQDRLKRFSSALGEGGGSILGDSPRSAVTCQIGECGRIEFALPAVEDQESIIIDIAPRHTSTRRHCRKLSPTERRRLSPESKRPSFSVRNGIGIVKIPPGFDQAKVIELLRSGGHIPATLPGRTITEATLSQATGSLYRAMKRSARARKRRLIPTVTPGFSDARFLRAKGIAAFGYFPVGSRERIVGIHGADEHIHTDTLIEARDELLSLVAQMVM